MNIGLIAHILLYNSKKEVLIMKRSASEDVLPDYWDIPGGTVKNGEDPLSAALRELEEEAGLRQSQGRLFYHTSNIDKGKDKQFVRLVFIAEYQGGDIRLNPDDHDQYAWVGYDSSKLSDYRLVDYLDGCFQALSRQDHPIIKLIS